jgi:hypothetical protein
MRERGVVVDIFSPVVQVIITLDVNNRRTLINIPVRNLAERGAAERRLHWLEAYPIQASANALI